MDEKQEQSGEREKGDLNQLLNMRSLANKTDDLEALTRTGLKFQQ